MSMIPPCFACPSALRDHAPASRIRTLCPDHMRRTETLSGASLPEVISALERDRPGGPLEGAPLQWLFGRIRVRVRGHDDVLRAGWCVYVPAVFFVAEDRFGATSWFDFWISDLSLEADDFRRPALDTLARALPDVVPATPTAMGDWVRDVAGPQGLRELTQAWTLWSGEARVAERRRTTGRIWPNADELEDWLFDPHPSRRPDATEEKAFAADFMRSLRKRREHRRGT